MSLMSESLYLFMLLFGAWLMYKGFEPMAKVLAGHLPFSGLREAIAA